MVVVVGGGYVKKCRCEKDDSVYMNYHFFKTTGFKRKWNVVCLTIELETGSQQVHHFTFECFYFEACTKLNPQFTGRQTTNR